MKGSMLAAILCAAPLLTGTAEQAWSAPESIEDRRRRVEAMTPEQKDELRRRYERFQALAPEEKERLRRLHESIETSPDREELRATMDRYTAWVHQLPSYRQAELATLPPAERAERVAQLLNEEEKKKERLPGPEDIEGIQRWFVRFLKTHEREILTAHPELARRLRQQPPIAPATQHPLLVRILLAEAVKMNRLPFFTEGDLADFLAELSPATRKKLESRPIAEQMRTVNNWVLAMLRQKAAKIADGGPLAPELQRELAQFFENDLSDQQRDRLLGMPGEDMQRELLRMYLSRKEPPRRPALREGPLRPDAVRPKPGPGLKPPLRGPRPGARPPLPPPDAP